MCIFKFIDHVKAQYKAKMATQINRDGTIITQLVQMHIIYATKIVSKCYYLNFDILQALSAEKK